jgi:hypothetical protein
LREQGSLSRLPFPSEVAMDGLVSYLVSAMLSWVPLYAQTAESKEEALTRYESIAQDVAAVAYDDQESPLFSGPNGRAQTALLMLSIASYESSYRKTVDDGTGLGDHGHSFCLMQIRVGEGITREGWSGKDLIAERTRCFRAALHILHGSFNVCHKLPMEDRMSAYATGRCFENAAVSRSRIGRARNWWLNHPSPPPRVGQS